VPSLLYGQRQIGQTMSLLSITSQFAWLLSATAGSAAVPHQCAIGDATYTSPGSHLKLSFVGRNRFGYDFADRHSRRVLHSLRMRCIGYLS
jgi:hypothetical protein